MTRRRQELRHNPIEQTLRRGRPHNCPVLESSRMDISNEGLMRMTQTYIILDQNQFPNGYLSRNLFFNPVLDFVNSSEMEPPVIDKILNGDYGDLNDVNDTVELEKLSKKYREMIL